MKNSIITLILLFSLSTGCSSDELPQKDKMPNPSFSYLALGDSYTIGQGVAVPDRYPVQLQDKLIKSDIALDSLLIIARTGWTTDELSRGIDATVTHPPYDLVTLLIGVNNQYRGRDSEKYRDEFIMLLNRAIGFAGDEKGRVVVLSIPDWGVTPFASGRDRDKIAREIDLFNAINREESEKAGVAWLDVTKISRMAAGRPELLAPDGLHPSGLMYRMWVDELFPIAKKILTEN
ncbi:MAG: SGNH/GDSL hydrolase family protein [Bacteroidales bacterium]|nr:SGNH/GDSL hydrolase family protein [Bacteroidales bacterium]